MIKEKRYLWADSLRAAATLAVIVLHVSVAVESGFGTIPMKDWLTANIYDSMVRWCVPIFVMLTGSFALNNYDGRFKPFLIKTFKRIILPFLFWSVVYLIYYNGGNLIDHNTGPAAKLSMVAGKLATGTAVHLWFVYMILGMYLLIPVLNRWVRQDNKAEQLFFLSLWVFFLFAQPLWEKYDISFDSSYFSGFIGYLILGNFLYKTERKVNSSILLLIFIGAVFYTCVRTYYLSLAGGEMNEKHMDNFMPNIVVTCISIYLLFKNNPLKLPVLLSSIVQSVSRYSYGIYLVHILVLDLFLKYANMLTIIQTVYSVPLLSLICLAISFAIVWVLNKIPYLRLAAG